MSKVRVRHETGRLFYDLTILGKRFKESSSLPDTPENHAKMDQVIAQIEREVAAGTLDYGRYFPTSKHLQAVKGLMQEANSIKAMKTPKPVTVETARPTEPETPLFEVFTETWIAENKVRWRINTIDFVKTLLGKHVLPRFSGRPVASITRPEVLKFRADLVTTHVQPRNRPLSTQTVNHITGLLTMIISEAAARYGFVNPCAGVKRLKQRRQDIEPFTLLEVQKIIETVRADFRNYFIFRFFTGVRTGEAHGLKWARVDFERRQVLIRETYGKGRTDYTKTDGSQREIRLSPVVLQALKAQEALTKSRSEYVFCNRDGGPLDEKNVTDRVWYPLLRHLKLNTRRPYQCRHTCATLWLSSGENPEWIARQLGHTSTEMLFRVYSSYVPNLTRRDGSAFDQMLDKALSLGGSEVGHG